MNAVDRILARMLRGDLAWPERGLTGEALLKRAQLHGVGSLLHEAIAGASPAPSIPQTVREALKARALYAAAIELGRRRELREVLALLAGAGIAPILMKGTALAYSLYALPSLRERSDTDLLIRDTDKQRLFELLEKQGYRRPNATSGQLVSSEATFYRNGSPVVLDVHWRINNSPLLSRVLDFGQADASAVSLPPLGPHARGLGPADALLLAAMHRASHFAAPFYADEAAHRGDRLVWLYDVHLLAQALAPDQWADVARRASRHGVSGLCLDVFRCTQDAFGTLFPPGVLQALGQAAATAEPTMVFLEGDSSRILWAELRSLGTWRLRWRLLREHAFPPAPYMLAKYSTSQRWLLPALYARRALGWLTGPWTGIKRYRPVPNSP